MARPLRIEYPGAFYHVMNRGAERKTIFLDPLEDRALFLNVLADSARLWKIRIHAYSLMDNHYHLLIETPHPNLSRAMRHLDGVYTQRVNRKHQRDGALFRGRFKSILVQKESYFLELIRYIHLNGVRAVLYPHPAADPHCSHGDYLGHRTPPTWLATDAALVLFGSDESAARQLFDAFVCDGIPKELEETLARKRWPAILGVKTFIDEIRHRFQLGKPAHREKPQERALVANQTYSPMMVIKRVTQLFGTNGSWIRRSREKNSGDAMRAAIYFLRYTCHLSYTEIGKYMGEMSDSGVQYHLEQLKQTPIQSELWKVLCDEFAIES